MNQPIQWWERLVVVLALLNIIYCLWMVAEVSLLAVIGALALFSLFLIAVEMLGGKK